MAGSDPLGDGETPPMGPVSNSGDVGSSGDPVLDPGTQDGAQNPGYSLTGEGEAPAVSSEATPDKNPPVDVVVDATQANTGPDTISVVEVQDSSITLSQQVEDADSNLGGQDLEQQTDAGHRNGGKEPAPAQSMKTGQDSESEKLKNAELLTAAAEGNKDTVKRLLDEGADVYTKDSTGNNALHLAARDSRSDVVKLLLDRFPDLSDTTGFNDYTPLELAVRAKGDSTEVLDVILEISREQVFEHTIDGETALHQALSFGNVEKAIAIAESPFGATIVGKPDEGFERTALHWACVNVQPEVAKVLLKVGTPLDARDADGNTPLHLAARSGDEEIMQLLLDHKDVKKAVNVLNVEHRNAMFNCIRYGEKAAKAWLQKLIQLDADLDVEDDMGWTILIYASVFGDKSIIEAIIEGGADVNQMPSDGWNALHTVVAKNMREQAEILLDKGAHIDTPTGDDEETAFHIALRSDHIDLVRLLLKRGADTTMKTKKGQSAWDLASEHDGDDYRVIKMELLKTLKDGEIDVGIAQVAAWTTWATFGPLLKRVDWQGKSGLRERLTLTCLASDPDRQSHEMLRSRLADKVETPPVESKDWTALDWAAYLGSSDLVLWQLKNRPPTRAALRRARSTVQNILEKQSFPAMKSNTRNASIKPTYKDTLDWLENPPFIQLQQNEKCTSSRSKKDRVKCTQEFDVTITDFYRKDQKSGKDGKLKLLTRTRTVENVIYERTAPPESESTEAIKKPKSSKQSKSPTQGNGEQAVVGAPTEMQQHSASANGGVKQKTQLEGPAKDKQRPQPTGPQEIMKRAFEDYNRLRSLEMKMDPLSEASAEEEFTERDFRFRWIHLPANNMEWMQDAAERVYEDKRSLEHPLSDFFPKSWRELRGSKKEVRFMRPTCIKETVPLRFEEGQHMRVPTEARAGEETAKTGEDREETPLKNIDEVAVNKDEEPREERQEVKKGLSYNRLALYMPYLTFSIHWPDQNNINPTEAFERDKLLSETYAAESDSHVSGNTEEPIQGTVSIGLGNESKSRETAMEGSHLKEEDEDAMVNSKQPDAILHKTRTLDEFYYDSLSNTHDRDKTQVITRYLNLKSQEAKAKDAGQPKEQDEDGRIKILRVDQIWLWVIDSETIITSSTNRIDEEEDPLIEGIHEYIGEAKGSNKRRLPLPTSVDEMTKFITTFCIEFMQRSKIKVVDEELSAKQIFANSINEAADKEANLFEKFKEKIGQKLRKLETERKLDSALRKRNKPKTWGLLDWLNGVRRQEITDQEKEYTSIQKATQVLVEGVWERLHDVHDSAKTHDRQDDKADDSNYRKQSEKWKSPIELRNDIDEMVKSTEMIQDGVKSILELEQNDASISEAEQARRLSEVTIEQGKTIMAFTLVTILFLPLSFLTSLFALNISVFPHKGDELFYSPDYIFPFIFGIAAVTFLVIASWTFRDGLRREFDRWRFLGSRNVNGAEGEAQQSRSDRKQADEKRNNERQSDNEQKEETGTAQQKKDIGGFRGILGLPIPRLPHRRTQGTDEEKGPRGVGENWGEEGSQKVPRGTVRGTDSDD